MKNFIILFFGIVWSILCFPTALIIYYLVESYNLSQVFSSTTEKLLRE